MTLGSSSSCSPHAHHMLCHDARGHCKTQVYSWPSAGTSLDDQVCYFRPDGCNLRCRSPPPGVFPSGYQCLSRISVFAGSGCRMSKSFVLADGVPLHVMSPSTCKGAPGVMLLMPTRWPSILNVYVWEASTTSCLIRSGRRGATPHSKSSVARCLIQPEPIKIIRIIKLLTHGMPTIRNAWDRVRRRPQT